MQNIYEFTIVAETDLDITEFNGIVGKSVFTTLPWIYYVKKDSSAKPVYVRITQNNQFIGYFTGLIVNKFGVKILGSPFRGWSTCFMGIEVDKNIDRCSIYKQLVPYLYKHFKCPYIEIVDRNVSINQARENGFMVAREGTLELPINMDDAALFKQMKTDCRNFIRQFERRGARLEIAEPNDVFAEQYYHQLEDVFAKQGLVPTYSLDKVKCLLKSMSQTESCLCLRVISPDERCIATSIFFGYGKKFFFWGGASYRSDQHYRPNEYMIWTAIKYWRERGCETFDMVGVRDYKKKFGSHEVEYARLIFTKTRLLLFARNVAEGMYSIATRTKGWMKKKNK